MPTWFVTLADIVAFAGCGGTSPLPPANPPFAL